MHFFPGVSIHGKHTEVRFRSPEHSSHLCSEPSATFGRSRSFFELPELGSQSPVPLTELYHGENEEVTRECFINDKML